MVQAFPQNQPYMVQGPVKFNAVNLEIDNPQVAPTVNQQPQQQPAQQDQTYSYPYAPVYSYPQQVQQTN